MIRTRSAKRRNVGLAVALLGLLVLVLSKPSAGTVCLGRGGGIDRVIVAWHAVGVEYGSCAWTLTPAGFVGLGALGVVVGGAEVRRNR
ncbi:hypothetical protein [Haladaptatus salinisoli]|uniref:hypothetical protein n=1 Tax=Haladaptatus salinisoli TaxID=2884876 RepID=UPI001D0BA646|nr:hypothetical protein [Haladaptatus salinisoli]